MAKSLIIVAGATGDLGIRIIKALNVHKATVRAIVRMRTSSDRLKDLRSLGVEIVEVDFQSESELRAACMNGTTVVSALSGLSEVIVENQTHLLNAAISAEVPRFIPSDFSMDFNKIPKGQNRNLDLRCQFHERLDSASIASTSILNGCFADTLTGQAPFILDKINRVLCWENADQKMDFTTMDDTAAYTASVALDSSTPKQLRIAGDQVCARDLARIMTELTGREFSVLRPGGLNMLELLIKFTRTIARGSPHEVYPPWQGMQYFYGMYSGQGKLDNLDNRRYENLTWQGVRTVLARKFKA